MKKVITIIMIILIAALLIRPALAAEHEPGTDYMAVMIATAVVVDADCGRQAESLEETKKVLEQKNGESKRVKKCQGQPQPRDSLSTTYC